MPHDQRNKVDLIYKLEGSAVNEGIDILKLSPMLLSIGELIQESQSIAHPGGHELTINVKPFEKGSFIIEMALFAKDNLHQLLDIVNSDPAKDVKELLEWLGLISGAATGATIGVVKIYKFLKGKPKRVEKLESGDVKLFSNDDNSITVNKKSFALFQNTNIQQKIYNIYGDSLANTGVDKVSSYLKSEPDQKVEVSKAEVAYFNPANAILNDEDETANEKKNIVTMFLNPKRVSVEGEPDNWSFRKGQDEIIKATIKDNEFLDKLKRNEIRLVHGDLLEVTVVIVQSIGKDGQVYSKNEIIKVLNYKPAPIQGTILE